MKYGALEFGRCFYHEEDLTVRDLIYVQDVGSKCKIQGFGSCFNQHRIEFVVLWPFGLTKCHDVQVAEKLGYFDWSFILGKRTRMSY